MVATEWVVTVGMADLVGAMELWCYVAGVGERWAVVTEWVVTVGMADIVCLGETMGIGWLVLVVMNSEIGGMMSGWR